MKITASRRDLNWSEKKTTGDRNNLTTTKRKNYFACNWTLFFFFFFFSLFFFKVYSVLVKVLVCGAADISLILSPNVYPSMNEDINNMMMK